MTRTEAREAMRLHARTGISLKEAWRRIRGGQGSHGGGHKTKSATRSRGHSSRSSAHSGGHSTASKPKPRVAVYAGLLGSALAALHMGQGDNNYMYDLATPANRTLAKASFNATSIVTNRGGQAMKVAVPAIVGVAVSWGADKLGANKVLAKAKAPVRI